MEVERWHSSYDVCTQTCTESACLQCGESDQMEASSGEKNSYFALFELNKFFYHVIY